MSKSQRDFHKTRRVLVALLSHPGDRPVSVSALSHEDAMYMTITCAAEVMLHALAITTVGDCSKALEGLKMLELQERLKVVCEGVTQHAGTPEFKRELAEMMKDLENGGVK